MIRRKYYAVAVTIVVLLILKTTVFVVDETRTAIVTQFGRPVRVITTAGLKWKLPQPIQAVRMFDRRLLVYDPKPTEFLTNDKKNVVVDAFVAWRIADPSKFLETVNDRAGAEVRRLRERPTSSAMASAPTPSAARSAASCRPMASASAALTASVVMTTNRQGWRLWADGAQVAVVRISVRRVAGTGRAA